MSHSRRSMSLLAALLAFLLAFSWLSGSKVYAASSSFAVMVGNKTISFQKDGKTTGSYRMSRNDIVLVTDGEDDLLVCFYNADEKYVGVTLGSQENVTLNGSIDSLTLHNDLDRNVIVGSKCTVEQMTVNTPVKVSVYGDIDTLDINAGASVIAVKGSEIGIANRNSSSARLTIKQGASVNKTVGGTGTSSSTNTSSSDSSVTFRTDTIYVQYGDQLRDYYADLQASVRAYYEKKRVTGEVDWTLSGSTVVKKTGLYRFLFTPDNSKLEPTYGTIRLTVDDGSNKETLEMDISTITVQYNTKRLGDLNTKLRQNVKAYDIYGKLVPGTLRWVNENERVQHSGYYEFIFVPNSNKYGRVQDSVKIQIENEEILGDSGVLSLDVVDIDTKSTSRRLRNYTTQLQNSVTAYDVTTGKVVAGKVTWVDNTMLPVTETEEFEFCFTPNDKRNYQKTYGTIIIYVDD